MTPHVGLGLLENFRIITAYSLRVGKWVLKRCEFPNGWSHLKVYDYTVLASQSVILKTTAGLIMSTVRCEQTARIVYPEQHCHQCGAII